MYFTKLLLAAAGCAVANAAVSLTNADYAGITVGVPFEITWTGQVGLVSVLLKNGPGDDQLLVGTLAGKSSMVNSPCKQSNSISDGLTGNSWVWTPAKSLPDGTYNLEIDDTNGDVNYSPQFKVTGGVELPITSEPHTDATTVTSSATSVPSSKSVPLNTAASNTTTISIPLSTGGPNSSAIITPSGGFHNGTATATGVAPSKTGRRL